MASTSSRPSTARRRVETPVTRTEWVRHYYQMSAKEFAAGMGKKQGAYSNWLNGPHGPSLAGVLDLYAKYKATPDFIFLGLTGNLPPAMRAAWEARPDQPS